MFILAVFFAIVIGYLLKGKLRNLEKVEVHGIYLIFLGFFIEAFIVFSIRRGFLARGGTTLVLNLIMYGLIFYFIYKNSKNIFLLAMGLGFLLNAIVIFANGGGMPVSLEAMNAAGLTLNVSREGLYILANESTKLRFLGDVIPFTFITKLAISIGDIISAIALMLFIITSMLNGKIIPDSKLQL